MRRTLPRPDQPLCAVEFLQRRFRLECLRLAGKGLCAKHANRRVGAREFRPFAAAVNGKAGCDVGRDAGVRPAIAAHQQIEPPALGHADRLPDAAPVAYRPNCRRKVMACHKLLAVGADRQIINRCACSYCFQNGMSICIDDSDGSLFVSVADEQKFSIGGITETRLFTLRIVTKFKGCGEQFPSFEKIRNE